MNIKNENSIPKYKKIYKGVNAADMNNDYFQSHSSKKQIHQNNFSDSNETSSSTGRYISKQNSFNIYKSNEILKKIKLNKNAKYFGEKKIRLEKKDKKGIHLSESKVIKTIKSNSSKNILINENYNINTTKKNRDNFSNRYNSNSEYKNNKLYYKKILKNSIIKSLKSPKNSKININSIKINNNSSVNSSSIARIHFYKNKSKYLNNNKMSISDINIRFSENDTDDYLGVNSVKTNDYKVNKPREMNLKYKFFKNYLNDEEKIINVSHISKIFIGQVDEYKDIIDYDNNFPFRDKYDTIHQRSKTLYSKNLLEDLNKIYKLLDKALPDGSEENVDDEFATNSNYHRSRNCQKYIKLIQNTVENSSIKRINRVYSKKKIKSKSKWINKNRKSPLPNRTQRPYLMTVEGEEGNMSTESKFDLKQYKGNNKTVNNVINYKKETNENDKELNKKESLEYEYISKEKCFIF